VMPARRYGSPGGAGKKSRRDARTGNAGSSRLGGSLTVLDAGKAAPSKPLTHLRVIEAMGTWFQNAAGSVVKAVPNEPWVSYALFATGGSLLGAHSSGVKDVSGTGLQEKVEQCRDALLVDYEEHRRKYSSLPTSEDLDRVAEEDRIKWLTAKK
jgi:hypothetical protein